MSSKKDKEELLINPITKKLDLVIKFNPDRILTAERNSAGSLFHTYDPASGTFIQDSPKVIIDDEGNVVVV